jgi:hypothetical protein
MSGLLRSKFFKESIILLSHSLLPVMLFLRKNIKYGEGIKKHHKLANILGYQILIEQLREPQPTGPKEENIVINQQ